MVVSVLHLSTLNHYQVSNLGHRPQGKRFVYPLPHLRDDLLYGRAVRRVDAGKKVGLEPYRGFHERILRG